MARKAKSPVAEVKQGSRLQDALRLTRGEGSTFLANDTVMGSVPTLPTSCLELNQALGGGWAKGRLVEVYGQESSGKTTLALDTIANAQRLDPECECLYIDVENALDPTWAEKLGVDLSRMPIAQPSSAEQAMNLIADALELGPGKAPAVIVLDSIAGLVTEAELKDEAEDNTVGLVARLMSKMLKKFTAPALAAGTVVLGINQERAQIRFGSAPGARTTPGGKAMAYYASQRVSLFGTKIKLGGKSDDDGKIDQRPIVGLRVHARVDKNKVAPPFRKAEFRVFFASGIDPIVELIEFGLKVGAVQLAGAWVKLDAPDHAKANADGLVQLGQGMANAIERVRTDPELAEQVRAAIVRKGG